MENTGSLYFNFAREYWRNIRGIGSLMPDSRVCVDALLAHVPFGSAKIIVECGAASGAVTREIIRRKRPETLLISFEKNAMLHSLLQSSSRGRNVAHVNADIFTCPSVLSAAFGVTGAEVDCIVSTLPCSCLDVDGLLRTAVLPVLADDGVFIQYMHTLSVLKGFRLGPILRKHYGSVHSQFVLRNLPPTLVYACRIPRKTAAQAV